MMKTEAEELQEFVDLIDDMLLDDDYCFASDTLEGIREWIKGHDFITDKQKEAVTNIHESK